MKLFRHPNGMIAEHFKTEFAEGYKICDANGLLVFGDERMTKENLIEFGFVEVSDEVGKVEPDWIYESCKELFSEKSAEQLLEFEKDEIGFMHREYRRCIEKHMPKQKKLSKSEVAVYCNRTGNRVLEDCMIFFLRDHNLLEE